LSNEDGSHILIDGVDMVYETPQQPLRALAGISVSVRRGEFLSVIGPSGCGKTTLLRIVGGLLAPTAGRVLIDGRPPREAQREKQIGFVFQDPSLLPWRNVAGNVRLPLQVNRSFSSKASARDPDHLIDTVGLTQFRSYFPHQLSGGMQQRVALARSLVTSPSLLLMDEPFGALDEITRSAMRFELMRIWRAEAAERQCTVVFVTHSITEAVLLSDRVLVMSPLPGRVAASLEINAPRPRDETFEETAEFIDHTRRLRGLLREYALV
jgi:NitT/TauT family transport system ATP-binding protein